jgi:hypothetical protein
MAPKLAGRLVSGLTVGAGIALGVSWATQGCYTATEGRSPDPNGFYYPVGLATSHDRKTLYVVNSDFDLRYNGGTLQAYDLKRLRGDAARLVAANLDPSGTPPEPPIPFTSGASWQDSCTSKALSGSVPGQTCAPPVDSTQYVLASVVIGAFATDLKLNPASNRLFMPVRGSATVTWADVTSGGLPDCGAGADRRCDARHQVGNDPNSLFNSRHVTMPGEPFGMAFSDDATVIAVTHQTDTKTSLLTTGLGNPAGDPTMQFVLDGVPGGGNGIVAVPHDPAAVRRCEDPGGAAPCIRQAFLQTSRAAAEIDLLRYYDDDGSSVHRPFLQKEIAYGLSANSGGADSRGIVVDDTPRRACHKKAMTQAEHVACGQRPARVFIANRTPASLVVGEIGEVATDGSYDPDRLVVTGNVPLSQGPSKVYLAPIIDASGHYSVRVFIACFESATVYVYDPDAQAVENVIHTAPGPFAMAFDSFDLDNVAVHGVSPEDFKNKGGTLDTTYRFAYIASFTQSFVQVVDLDDSQPNRDTFERVVFTFGPPTNPIGQ